MIPVDTHIRIKMHHKVDIQQFIQYSVHMIVYERLRQQLNVDDMLREIVRSLEDTVAV